MRLTAIGAALVVAGCAGTQTADTTQAAKRACGGIGCFYERDIRDFEVIDHTTLIVYVGAQRCPYQVELIGTFCDMQFATQIYFTSPSQQRTSSVPAPRTTNTAAPAATTAAPVFDPLPASQINDLRICPNDISISVSGGAFTSDPANAKPGTRQFDCQLSSIASLTDDKLMELYVRKGVVAPPPPMGAGQIQVGAQTTPPPSGSAGGAGPPPGGSPQGAGPASELNEVAR